MVFGIFDRKHYNMMTKILQFNDIFCNRKSWASDQAVQMIDKSSFGNDVCGHGDFRRYSAAQKEKGHGFKTDLQFETVASVTPVIAQRA